LAKSFDCSEIQRSSPAFHRQRMRGIHPRNSTVVHELNMKRRLAYGGSHFVCD
jgi:hypothetical protein